METIYDKIRKKPFYLNDEDVAWVKETLARMTLEDKAGQLFCLIVREGTEEEISDTLKIMKPGGFMYRQMTLEKAVRCTEILHRYSDIPYLISANLEKGGNGIIKEGTLFQAPMGLSLIHI